LPSFLLNVDNQKFLVGTTAGWSLALKSCKTKFKCNPSHHELALCGIINANSQLLHFKTPPTVSWRRSNHRKKIRMSERETEQSSSAVPDVTFDATNAMFAALYPDLKRLARSRLRTVGARTILDTTMLVHDTYARLAEKQRGAFATSGQFMAYCGQAMRSVIVDLVRANSAARRGGGEALLELNTEVMQSAAPSVEAEPDVLRVHEALAQLAALDPRLVRLVELRYFAGLSEAEAAATLGMAARTASREWERARALLRAMMNE
jgi:RNA polymerase sigma factor (TIGR02999 family)